MKDTTKLTFPEFRDAMWEYNETHDYWNNPLYGKIVFKSSNWPNKNYTTEELTYLVNSDNKCFRDCPSGSVSIFAKCAAEGTDPCIRLDYFMEMYEGDGGCKVDYCEITNEKFTWN